MRFALLVLVTGVLGSQCVMGESLKDKKMMADQDKSFQEEVAATNTACGTKVTGSIQWDGFLKNKSAMEGFSLSGFCASGLTGMRMLCGDATAKSEIIKKIKSYKCEFGGPGKRAALVASGNFSVKVDFTASNNDDFFKEYLENHL